MWIIHTIQGEGVHSIFRQSFHLFPVIMPCFWWQIYRQKYPTRTFKNLRFNTAFESTALCNSDAAAASLGEIAEGLCTLKWDTKTRRVMSPPAGLSTKTKVTRTRKATGDYRQCTNREHSQTMTTFLHFLHDLCLVGQMLHRCVSLCCSIANTVTFVPPAFHFV